MSVEMPQHDYYEILQVHPKATLAVIKKAYRTLLLEEGNHPDQGGSEANASLITEAYRVLSDTVRRAEYDRSYFGQFHPGATEPVSNSEFARASSARAAETPSAPKTNLIVLCPQCRTKNRVRSQELLSVAKCSRCGQALSQMGNRFADLKEHAIAYARHIDQSLRGLFQSKGAAKGRPVPPRPMSKTFAVGVPLALIAMSVIAAGYTMGAGTSPDVFLGFADPIETTDKLRKEGKLQQAATVLERAVDREPANPRLYEKLGDVYVKQLNYEEALVQYGKAIALNPQNSYLHTLRGNTYLKLDNMSAAEICYKSALQIDPSQAPALVSLGNVYARKQRFKEAANLYQQAMHTQPSADVLFNLGVVYHLDNRHGDAVGAFKNALLADPNHRSSMVSLASVFYEQGKYDLAVSQLTKASQLKHADLDLHLRLAEIYEKTGQTPAAIREWTVCLQQGKNNPAALDKARRALTRLKVAVTG